jgi:tetratricopeptide (TPR) repeat protein/4-amino-4-deoxy-L-arabinose transferase-like glycosyltransferase
MSKGIGEKDKEKIVVLGLFVFAYALRFVYMLQMESNPHFFSPTMDPLFHDAWAQDIASGNWIGSHVFFRAPFYAYFLAVVYKLFGHGYILPRLIQHLVGSFSCVLIYLLARKLFGRTVAIVAGIIAATYGMFLYFEDELLLDSFLVFFDLLLILLLLRAKEVPRLTRWLGCGLILGVSAITRPNILFFIPFVWLWIYLAFRGTRPFKRIAGYWAWLLVGVALVVLPVTLRNLLVAGDLVLISSQGGINFYIGNNENADGVSAIFYSEHWEYRDFQSAAEKQTGRSMTPSQISNFYYRKGLEFFIHTPWKSFKLLVKKVYLFWSRFEISNNQDIYFYRRYSSLIRVLPLGFWCMGPLGLAGMIISYLFARRNKRPERRKTADQRKKILLPVLFVFSYMLTVVMFFVPARFRLPVIPLLMVFSAFALVWLVRRARRRDLASIRIWLLVLVPFLFLTNTNAYHQMVGGVSLAQAHFGLGNVYLKTGQLDLARAQFDTALALNPHWSRAHLNRGMVFFRKGDYGQAEKDFLAELKLNPDEAQAYNDLAAIYLRQERYDETEEMAKKAIELDPYAPNPHMNLALAYQRTGRIAQAKEALRQGISKVKPFFDAELVLGEIYQAQGQPDSAASLFRQVINPPRSEQGVAYDLQALTSRGDVYQQELGQLRAKAHFNLGTIYMQRGEVRQAEAHLRQAVSLDSHLTEALANLGILYDHTGRSAQGIPLLQQAVNLEPDNAAYHYNLGLAYAKQGRLETAKQEFETSLNLDPSLTDAREKVQLVDSLLEGQGQSP